MAGGAVIVKVNIDICEIAAGVGGAGLSPGDQANSPGFGQAGGPGPVPMAQTLRLMAAEAIPGTPGSYTLANVNTALSSIVTDIAGATGTPKLTAAILALINGWNSGNP